MFPPMFRDNLDRFFSKLEWRWSLANYLWGAAAVASVTLPAWAVYALGFMGAYSPLSWVVAGFVGFLVFCVGFFIYAVARERVVRARYNARAFASGGYTNPMEQIFERKRIYLNDFALPSNPFIQDKTFIDCEIIGPSNVFLLRGNRIDQPRLPICDAAVLPPGATIFNSYSFIDCTFRRCSFQRVTFFVSDQEYPFVKHLDWLNWVTYRPDSDFPLLTKASDQLLELRQDTEEEAAPKTHPG